MGPGIDIQLPRDTEGPASDNKQPAVCCGRVGLEIFGGSTLTGRVRRDRKIREAVERFGYAQRAMADFLRFRFTHLRRILSERQSVSNIVDLISFYRLPT
jgi:hypothetical protein